MIKKIFWITILAAFVLGFCGTTTYRAMKLKDQISIIRVETKTLKSENDRLINEYKLMKQQRDFCFDAVADMVEEQKEEN
jgi:cell division protein FtsB